MAADKVVSNEMIGEEECLGKYSPFLALCLTAQIKLSEFDSLAGAPVFAVIYEWEVNLLWSSER